MDDMPFSILSPINVMGRGLHYVGIYKEQQAKLTMQKKVGELKSHYSSLPLVLANIWFDLCNTMIEEACLKEKEKSERGFKGFYDCPFLPLDVPKEHQAFQELVQNLLVLPAE